MCLSRHDLIIPPLVSSLVNPRGKKSRASALLSEARQDCGRVRVVYWSLDEAAHLLWGRIGFRLAGLSERRSGERHNY